MIEHRALLQGEKLEIISLLYARANRRRLTPAVKTLLHLYIDMPAALHWSNARIAMHTGYSVRTVVRANTELVNYGILFIARKRRETAVKRVSVKRALEVLREAVQFSKEKCAAAVARLRAGLEVTAKPHSNHRFKTMALKEALTSLKVASVSDLTPQLRRLMLGG